MEMAHKIRNTTSKTGYDMIRGQLPLPDFTTLQKDVYKRKRTNTEGGAGDGDKDSGHSIENEDDLNAIIASMNQSQFGVSLPVSH
jgi:hypothetical protein